MEVLKYLNEMVYNNIWYEQALNRLKDEFGIKVSVNEKYPNLVVLNYDQINSSKHKEHPIVRECRSLVLRIPEYDFGVPNPTLEEGFTVSSRAFDRFFNINETEEYTESNINFSEVSCFEKVDGSLVSLWYDDKYGWIYRTKSLIMPDLNILGYERSWKDLIDPLLNLKDNSSFLDKSNTYIFEVVSRENRVVTRYSEDSLYLLAIRRNSDGKYL